MANFNTGNKFRGGDGNRFSGQKFGNNKAGNKGFRGGSDSGSGRKEMHRAICDECGKNCEVPFKPTGDKPVFCSDCFKKRSGGGNSGREKRDFKGGDSGMRTESREHNQQNVYRNSDFYRTQLDQINSKLDKILKVVSATVSNEGTVDGTPNSKKYQKVKKEIDKVALGKAIKKTASNKNKVTKKTSKKSTKKK